MADTKQLTVKLAIQASGYRNEINSINKQNKLLESSFKAVSSSSENFDKTLEGKKAKLKLISSQLDNAKQKVAIYKNEVSKCSNTLDKTIKSYENQEAKVNSLKKELEEAKNVFGENSKEVNKLKKELEQEEKVIESNRKAVVNADNSLTRMSTELNKAQSEVNKLSKEFNNCEKETKELESKVGSLSEKLENASSKIQKSGKSVTDTGKKFSLTSTAVAGIGAVSVKTAANFESAMSQVAATMGMTSEEINSGSKDFEKLEKAAKEMGATTQFSASEAADALNYLALAGYDVDKSVSTLPTILNLAAAGGIDLASASDMVTDAMSALGLETNMAGSFVDEMAKTSQKSNTSVAQLGEAILTVGGTAKVLAGGTVEMNTALGILADNGVKGAEGGTALRNVILSLSAPTDVAAKQMERLGLKVFDAQGNMRPLNDIFKDLDKTLSKMTQGEQTRVLSKLFNKVDLKSVNALLANSGDRFNELSGYIDNSDGAASNMAETMNDNLNGALKSLGSAFEGAMIVIGDSFIPIIRLAAEKLAEFATWFNNDDPFIQKLVAGIGLFTAALAPVLIVLGTIISAIGKVVGVFSLLSGAISSAGGIMALFTGPVGIIIGSITAVIGIGTLLIKNWENIKSTLSDLGESWSLAWNDMVDNLSQSWENIKTKISEALNNIKSFLSDLGESWSLAWNDMVNNLSQSWENIKSQTSKAWSNIVNYIKTNISNLVDNIKVKFENAKNIIVSIWNGIKSTVINIVSKLISGVVDFFKDIPNKISNALSNLVDIITNPFQTAFNTVKKIFKGISNVAGNIINKITGKSIDINTNLDSTYTPSNFNSAEMENIALSGSYYNQNSRLSSNFSKLASLSNKSTTGISDISTDGISINNRLDTSRLEELMSNMITLLNTQNTLIQENKPVFNLDGQQLSNKLDKINGQNMKLYERFNT